MADNGWPNCPLGQLAAAILVALAMAALITPMGDALARVVGQVRVTGGEIPDAPKGPAKESYLIVPTPVALEELSQKTGYPVFPPTYLPEGTRLEQTEVESYRSQGLVARLDYRIALSDGMHEVTHTLTIRQSRQGTGFKLTVSPELVIKQTRIGGHDAIVYTQRNPGQRVLYYMIWTNGEYYFEACSTLPIEEMEKIARSLNIPDPMFAGAGELAGVVPTASPAAAP